MFFDVFNTITMVVVEFKAIISKTFMCEYNGASLYLIGFL
jgi:hypothetical protein